MTPKDLDQLSKVITQALQVVDGVEGVKDREVTQNKRPDDKVKDKWEPGDQSHQVEKAENNTPRGTKSSFISTGLGEINI